MTRYYYNPEEEECLKFTYSGCKGNSNNFETEEECEEACEEISSEVCKKPPQSGKCLAYYERYYYNSTTHSCEMFVYGGCEGNNNRFHTKLECLMVCGKSGKCKIY
ncbi:actinia tenebrosa protease inhibitors-like [Sphaerodactylus townsendi]|uniref:actinia tenebrosa protease inhibitors-like n=1 Tax=Sphaerodactylus townsendi TaxID=933632 RepID=UPI0020261D8A|nr:actinia tenebrosa protease inhibitors-like [Sphaerodactylus townsendi]